MAKKKAAVKKASVVELDQVLADQTVCFAGVPHRWRGNESVASLVKLRGGTMVDEIAEDLDFLVLGKSGFSTARAEAENLNELEGAGIEILSEAECFQMLAPTREEVVDLLTGGSQSAAALCELLQKVDAEWPDLSGEDLRQTQFSDETVHADLSNLLMDDVDLRGAHLVRVWLPGMTGANLDGAVFKECHISGDCEFIKSSLKKASADGADFGACDITDADFSGSELARADFSASSGDGAVFKKAVLPEADLSLCTLTNADFSGIKAPGADFGGARVAKAIFIKADLRGARFTVADLRDCDFTNADLRDAELTGADLRGAVFKNAKLAGSNLQLAEVDLPAIAESADLPAEAVDTLSRVGQRLNELQHAITRAARIEIALSFVRGGSPTKISLVCSPRHMRATWDEPVEGTTETRQKLLRTTDVRPAFLSIAQRFHDAEFQTDLVEVRSVKSPVSGKQLKRLVLEAMCEAQGVAPPEEPIIVVPPPPPPRPRFAEKKEEEEEVVVSALPPMEEAERKSHLLELLRGGEEGISKWNALTEGDREEEGLLLEIDFSGGNLSGALLRHLAMKGANLARANLTGADISYSDLRNANLFGARIDNVKIWGTLFRDADLSQASLTGSTLRCLKLAGAKLRGANLSNSNVTDCDLRGADLTDCRIDGTTFTSSQHDEKTIWPAGFKAFEDLKWSGEGPNPADAFVVRKPIVAEELASATASRLGFDDELDDIDFGDDDEESDDEGDDVDVDDDDESEADATEEESLDGEPVDLPAFVESLKREVSAGKLDKALDMLKEDRFHLFAEVLADSITGVVTVDSDPDLLYSCRLEADGTFGCCGENLNVCPGLRGSLCKHLLVMIIGLVQAGRLDPKNAEQWVAASKLRKTQLNKELMSETFAKYKDAESGEVDWPATETVPEDFSAV
ncbi:MAG: pentapeptide repeat-containing protein [Planctomycetota bacterium]|nr:pentapeptide repeat-containing protein [Planctomycetota bacterium]